MWAVVNVLILRNWPLILVIPALCLQRDATWMAVALASFIICLDLRGLAFELISLKSGRQALDLVFSREKDGQTLEEVPAASVLAWLPSVIAKEWPANYRSTMQNTLLRSRLGLPGEFKKLKIYVRQFERPPYDHLLKAYTCFTGTSLIFLRDHVTRDSKPYERFKLFHEIAHVSATGMASLGDSYGRLIMAFASVVLALLTCDLTLLFAIGLVAFLARELLVWVLFPMEFEVKADLLAMSGLRDQAERNRALHLHTKALPKSVSSDFRLYRLTRAMKEIAQNPGKPPATASWNRTPSSTGFVWYGLLIWIGLHSLPLPFWPVFLACVGAVLVQVLLLHPIVFSLAAKTQQRVVRRVTLHDLQRLIQRHTEPVEPQAIRASADPSAVRF